MASRPEVARLRALSNMTRGELISRSNAIPDLLAAIAGVMPLLEAMPVGTSEETSAEVASLAAHYLGISQDAFKKAVDADINTVFTEVQSICASSLSQAPDRETLPLPLEDAATRSLIDAQAHGQAHPLTRTVEVGPGSTGKITAPYGEKQDGSPKDLEDLD